MKKHFIITLVIFMVTLFFAATLPATQRGIQVVAKTPDGKEIPLYKNSYALIVGNGNYIKGWDPLPGAIRDATDVANTLKRNGFRVTLTTDLTKDAFTKVFWRFCHEYGKNKDNRLLFYYAGHGHTEEMATGESLGYLVMVDAPVPEQEPMGFSLASVDMQTMVTQAKMIKARHVLFMFDSCFSGSILNLRERVVPQSISESIKLPVRQFITAGRANEPVPDHSIFKQAFLDLLEGRDREPIPDGYITGEELGLYLKTKVPAYNPTQHPQYGKIKDIKLDKGDFVFMLGRVQPDITSEKQRLAEERARLDRERREFEELKALADERKRLEAERKSLKAEKEKLEVANLPPKQKKPPSIAPAIKDGEIARDGKFIAYSNGTVLDTTTNLMWANKDSGRDFGYYALKNYIKTYRGGGYTDWRMPTKDELKTIYDHAKKNRHGYHVTNLIDITGEWVFYSRGWGNIDAFNFYDDSNANSFRFGNGYWIYQSNSGSERALPVRSGN